MSKKELEEFCQGLQNDLTVLFEAATIAQLNVMHEILQEWLEKNEVDPQSLKVVIIGPRTARQNNLQTTDFERLLGSER